MRDDCLQVDELLLQLADYTNDYAEATAEKLFTQVLDQLGGYRYLQDRAHDAWLPRAHDNRCGQIIKTGAVAPTARVRLAYEPS